MTADIEQINKTAGLPQALQLLERELSALRAVAMACTEELDENRLFERVTDIICNAMGIHNFGIVLFDEKTGLLHDHPSAQRGENTLPLYLALGEGITGSVALTGRPMRVPDVRCEPVYRMGEPETRSEVAVPLQVGDQVIGVINSESPEFNAFTEEDERLLVILAGQLASAVARLRNVRALREQEKKYRAIFENSGNAMIFVEEDATISICNKACETLAGCPREEIEGLKKWMDFVANEKDLARMQEYRRLRLTDPESAPSSYEYAFRPVRGTLRDVSVTVNVIPGTRQMLIAIMDITERKRMETAIIASEERYHSLFNNIPVGLYQTTPEGWCIEANKTFLEMLGFKNLKAYQEQDASAGYANPNEREEWCQELEAHGFIHREMQWKRRDGSLFWVEERARVHRDSNNHIYYDGSAIDITERKRAETEGEQLRERLRQSEKIEAIGQLAGGVAHDFNNQLAAIMGFADALAELASTETQKRYAANIARSCQRSAELTNQLLAFARKGKLLSVPLNFHQIVEEVVSLLKYSLDKRITIHHRLEADQVTILGDPTQLQSALMNMAINSRDAMPEGGELTFETKVRNLSDDDCMSMPYEMAPGAFLEIKIVDTGVGMDPDTQRRIFEPFFTTKELGKGTGLGMASVYGTVKQHKGMIHVESALGRGTRITISFPLAEMAVEKTITPLSKEALTGTGHILIVDDEDMVAEMISEILGSLKYRVTVCRDGVEAVAFYRKAWPEVDLVILDIMMPRMGGKDAFQAMRKINPVAKVLLISGFSVEGEAQHILEAGALGFIQKPFRIAELAQELARVLQDR